MKNLIKSSIFLSILPLVIVATSLEIALISGLVLLLVTISIKGLSFVVDKFIEGRFRNYTYIVIAAGLISVLTIILGTYLSSTELFSIYFALIIMNLDLVYNPEEKTSFVNQLVKSLIALAILIVIGLLREVLGTGTLTISLFNLETIEIFKAKYAFAFLQQVSGGFVLAGFVFGIINSIEFKKKEVVENVL